MAKEKTNAQKLKAQLKQVYPRHKFSCRSDGGGSIYISWTGGPTVDAVRKMASQYEKISRCEITHEILLGGNTYISTSRDFTIEQFTEALEAECQKYGIEQPPVSLTRYGNSPFIHCDDLTSEQLFPGGGVQRLPDLVNNRLAETCFYGEKQARKAAEPAPSLNGDTTATWMENAEKGGIEIRFSSRPSPEVRAMMREGKRFRWHPRLKFWYGKKTDESLAIAKHICGEVDVVVPPKIEQILGIAEVTAQAPAVPAPVSSPEPEPEPLLSLGLQFAPVTQVPEPAQSDQQQVLRAQAELGDRTLYIETPAEEPADNPLAGQIEKWLEMADSYQSEIDDRLSGGGLENTYRRARMAASRRQSGYDLQDIQRMLRYIAAQAEVAPISIPKGLHGLRTKKWAGWLAGQTKYWMGNCRQTLSEVCDRVWSGSSYSDERKALVKMGVTNPRALAEIVTFINPAFNMSEAQAKAEQDRALELEVCRSKIPGFFPTPDGTKGTDDVIAKMLEQITITIDDGDAICEPSAGRGDILTRLKQKYSEVSPRYSAFECNFSLRKIIQNRGHEITGHDWLDSRDRYKLVVMNPPYENGQDAEHVLHAYDRLAPGGQIVALVSGAFYFRTDKRYPQLRKLVDNHGSEESLGQAFAKADRPTNVQIVMLTISKPLGRQSMSAWHVDRPQPPVEASAAPEVQPEPSPVATSSKGRADRIGMMF